MRRPYEGCEQAKGWERQPQGREEDLLLGVPPWREEGWSE